jgi:hypothetical protein
MFCSTACIIPASSVPEGLEAFRRSHIHHPGSVFPLHTTIIYPFLDYDDLTGDNLARLKTLAATFEPFEYVANSICAFPTSRALWLSPSPQRPFEQITEALYREFPQFRSDEAYPTYHMTIAYNSEESVSEALVNRFLEEFKSEMPFNFIANELAIYGEDNGQWARLYSARFGKD